MIGAERKVHMTDTQLIFANSWMSLFDYDREAIIHQLSIKVDYDIEGFSGQEAREIWDFIDIWANEATGLD